MIWVAGRSPTLVSHSLRGVATNLKATTLAYLAIILKLFINLRILRTSAKEWGDAIRPAVRVHKR
jgi:hypothetical protein